MYDPTNWYWLADDGRVYSSARQVIVDENDQGYADWTAGGQNAATPWPRDDAGEQTDTALQAVIAPYNMFVNLKAYAANKRWEKEVGGITVTANAQTFPIKTDDRAQAKINGVRIAVDQGHFPSGETTPWLAADYKMYPLNSDGIIAMSDTLQQHVNTSFVTLQSIGADIDSGTITTRQQVDDAFNAALSATRSSKTQRTTKPSKR
jgi:hypothetical protein